MVGPWVRVWLAGGSTASGAEFLHCGRCHVLDEMEVPGDARHPAASWTVAWKSCHMQNASGTGQELFLKGFGGGVVGGVLWNDFRELVETYKKWLEETGMRWGHRDKVERECQARKTCVLVFYTAITKVPRTVGLRQRTFVSKCWKLKVNISVGLVASFQGLWRRLCHGSHLPFDGLLEVFGIPWRVDYPLYLSSCPHGIPLVCMSLSTFPLFILNFSLHFWPNFDLIICKIGSHSQVLWARTSASFRGTQPSSHTNMQIEDWIEVLIDGTSCL